MSRPWALSLDPPSGILVCPLYTTSETGHVLPDLIKPKSGAHTLNLRMFKVRVFKVRWFLGLEASPNSSPAEALVPAATEWFRLYRC